MHAINISLPVTNINDGDNLLDQVDQFMGSDFYFKDGMPLPDIVVSMNASSDPELKAKIQETMIVNEIKSNGDLTDDQILSNLQSKYEDRYSMFQRISKREIQLKKAEQERIEQESANENK